MLWIMEHWWIGLICAVGGWLLTFASAVFIQVALGESKSTSWGSVIVGLASLAVMLTSLIASWLGRVWLIAALVIWVVQELK